MAVGYAASFGEKQNIYTYLLVLPNNSLVTDNYSSLMCLLYQQKSNQPD